MLKKAITIILCAIMSLLLFIPSFANNALDPSAWYYKSAKFCIDREYIDETEDNYDGSVLMTRAEFVVLLYHLDNSPTPPYDDPELDPEYPFSDMTRGDYYIDALTWAADKKVVAGKDDGSFGINDPITREQVVCIMRTFAEYKGMSISSKKDITGYPDYSEVSKWARDAYSYAMSEGIIAGTKNSGVISLSPKLYATLSEGVTIIKGYYDKIQSKEEKELNAKGNFVIMGGGGKGMSDSQPVYDEIVRLTGSSNPNLLYIGFALTDPAGDYSYIQNYFTYEYNANCDILNESELSNTALTKQKVEKADIVYCCGGSSERLIKVLKDSGVDLLLREAAKRGCVMCGTSAGAIVWCESGESQITNQFARLDGIGLINALCCPHALTDEPRYALIEGELRKTPYMSALALDGAAFEMSDGKCRQIIHAKEYMGKVCKIVDGKYVCTDLPNDWTPLEDVLY